MNPKNFRDPKKGSRYIMAAKQNVHSNEAINSNQLFEDIVNKANSYGGENMGFGANIIGGLASPYVALHEAYKNRKTSNALSNAFEKMYNENGKFLYSKAGLGIAGAALGIRAGMGAIRGAFTDGEGSIDLPGIPFL